MNVRDRELRIIDKMLSLNTENYNSVNFSDQWKVLVYDPEGRDVISPLLNVGALRAKGVTLHMLLHSDREAVPDAPAVYFVRPTEANLKRIDTPHRSRTSSLASQSVDSIEEMHKTG